MLKSGKYKGLIHTIFKRAYTPFLMKTPVRIIIIGIFVAALATHVIVIPQIEVGLDQKLSMPEDSYVLKYFKVRKKKEIINFISLKREKQGNRQDFFKGFELIYLESRAFELFFEFVLLIFKKF